MKSFLALGLAGALLLTGFRSVYNSAQPPVASTGAPRENSCVRCHSGTPVNGGGGSVILTGLPRGGYQPGVVYPLTVQVLDNTLVRNGFELQVVDNTTNAAAGILTAITPGNTVVRASGNRSYISHRNASSTASWVFNWTAPTAGSGGAPGVVFYVAAVAGNGSGNNQGDHVYTANFPLTAAPTGLADDRAAPERLRLFPNPARGRVTLAGPALDDARLLLLYDATGRLVRQQAPTTGLDVGDLPAGRYTLALVGADDRTVRQTLVVQP